MKSRNQSFSPVIEPRVLRTTNSWILVFSRRFSGVPLQKSAPVWQKHLLQKNTRQVSKSFVPFISLQRIQDAECRHFSAINFSAFNFPSQIFLSFVFNHGLRAKPALGWFVFIRGSNSQHIESSRVSKFQIEQSRPAGNAVKLIFRNLKDKQGLDLRFLPKLPGLAHEYFYLPWGIPGCSGL